ncbi:hypothetical protein ACIQ7D_35860 [Streptomyces sp. NPDC096310]|uniref:hypothetical protein n=1 Tax=Streptomyces sp. NPDC096310 TaxID=3366082 RepID=UPI0037FA45F2
MSTSDEAAPTPLPDPTTDHPDTQGTPDTLRTELTPRQARLLRITLASALLLTLATLLAIRLAERTSVLVVGVYGLAMILCGVVIELSRHGRTRLSTWLLGAGLLTALAADWLLLP